MNGRNDRKGIHAHTILPRHFTLCALALLTMLSMGCAASTTGYQDASVTASASSEPVSKIPGDSASSPAHSPGPDVSAPTLYVTTSKTPEGFSDIVHIVAPEKLKELTVLFDLEANSSSDFQLDLQMTYRNLTESEFETIWRTTTLFLLTIYPSTCGHRAYMLTATLKDANGHSRTYVENDTTVAWLWLLHGSNCGENPTPEEIESQSERMLNAVLEKMLKDDAFTAIGKDAPEENQPLVNIVTNRAEDVVNQVLNVERPFARWTLGADPTQVPDYLVDIHFDVQPSEPSMMKAYAAIMVAGLISPCKRSTFTLTATVTGPGAVMTKSYTFTDSLSGRMATVGCENPDEKTNPEVFAKLLRKVFRQIDQDQLIKKGSHQAVSSLPPLVRITASRAMSVVRQETEKAGPFARYYFHDSDEYSPDYTLRLNFQFTGGGQKQRSLLGNMGAGFIMAFGININCNPTTMILDAVLCNRSGEEVRRFHIERTFSFSGKFHVGCQDNEKTNPGAVDELVRELYKEMKTDSALVNTEALISPPQ